MPFTPLSPFSDPDDSPAAQENQTAASAHPPYSPPSPYPKSLSLPPIQGNAPDPSLPKVNPFAPRAHTASPAAPVSSQFPLRNGQNRVHSTSDSRAVPGGQRKVFPRSPVQRTSSSPSVVPDPMTLSLSSSSRPAHRRRPQRRVSRSTANLRVMPSPGEFSSHSSGDNPEDVGYGSGGKQHRATERLHQKRSRAKRLPAPVLFALRLLILGVGLGVITGTLLAALDPITPSMAETSETETTGSPESLPDRFQRLIPMGAKPSLKLGNELTALTQKLTTIAEQQPDLVAGAFVVDVDTGSYAGLNSQRSFATASMIKIPVLVAFFQDVDAGKIDLAEQLTMREDLVAPHAGDMQYQPVGTQFSALETAVEMIRISDNTATNMLIDRLGGIAALNERFEEWGLQQTKLNEWLPDLEGTNISSPKDLVTLMSLLEQGQLVSLRSRDRVLEILRTPVTRTLLPQGLGPGATIAHKTGDIGSLVGDVGLIDMPNGKRYLAAMMVERPHNDNRAQELIRQMSKESYTYLENLPQSDRKDSLIRSPAVITQEEQEQAVSPASLYPTAPAGQN